jgi:hypothetical protein
VIDAVRRHLESGEQVLHAFPARSGPDPTEPRRTVVELVHDGACSSSAGRASCSRPPSRILLVRASSGSAASGAAVGRGAPTATPSAARLRTAQQRRAAGDLVRRLAGTLEEALGLVRHLLEGTPDTADTREAMSFRAAAVTRT